MDERPDNLLVPAIEIACTVLGSFDRVELLPDLAPRSAGLSSADAPAHPIRIL